MKKVIAKVFILGATAIVFIAEPGLMIPATIICLFGILLVWALNQLG